MFWDSLIKDVCWFYSNNVEPWKTYIQHTITYVYTKECLLWPDIKDVTFSVLVYWTSFELFHWSMATLLSLWSIICLTFFLITSYLWSWWSYRSLKGVRAGVKIIEKRSESLGGRLAKAYKSSPKFPLYKDDSQ